MIAAASDVVQVSIVDKLVLPVLATVLATVLLGAAAWARSINKAVAGIPALIEKLGELAGDVRDLAAASTDAILTRAELRAHISLAEDRWRMLGGAIPHPRYATADDRVPAPAGAGE